MKNIINTLIRRSFAASKMRNLIAVLAIALTAILFTSVTTIGMGATQSTKLTMQLQKGSKSDGDLRNMNKEQFQALKKADFVKSAGLRMPVGFLSNTLRHNIDFEVVDKTQAELTFCTPSHGKMPEAANEIVASDLALQELGAEAAVGSEVTIEFTAHGQEYTLPMVVSGWYESINDQTSLMIAGTSFCEAHPDIFSYTYDKDKELAGTYWSDITAHSTTGLDKKMDDFSRSVGGNPDDRNAPNFLPTVVNAVTNPPVNLELLVMETAIAILFIFCGYLLIYNVFDIAVMQEIRRYGLYRTIGMGKRQVKKLINQQALWLSCIGIPAGLIVGFFIGKATLPVVMTILASDYKNVAVDISPSPILFICAALLTSFTVFLSTRKPLRVAANTPPIEAFHYVESSTGKRTHRRSSLGTNIPRLAWSNLGRNKRRSIFIMVSLMLCVVLLNCVGTASGSLDIEKQVSYMTRTDFSVVNAASTNLQKGFTMREQGLKPQTMNDIAKQPGVFDASPIYKNTVEDTNVTYDYGLQLNGQTQKIKNNPLLFGITDNGLSIGLGDDGRPISNVYGMSEIAISRMDIREGETDTHALYEKMAKGEGVLAGVPVDRSDMSLKEILDHVDIGQTITVYKDGQPVMELPVLAKAALNGDDEEIGYTVNGTVEVGGDGIFLYMPDSIFKKLYDEPVVYKYSFNVEKSEQDNMTAFLDNYMVTKNTVINYMSAQSARENAEGTRFMINFVGSLIGIIFGIAGALNLINTIITTILTRRHEFATMQSIGMTEQQLTKMMIFEGIYYALGACLLGLVFSVVLNLTLVKGILGTVWYYTFQFTLIPAIIASVVLMILAAIIPVLALKLFNKGSIVEQLRIAE